MAVYNYLHRTGSARLSTCFGVVFVVLNEDLQYSSETALKNAVGSIWQFFWGSNTFILAKFAVSVAAFAAVCGFCRPSAGFQSAPPVLLNVLWSLDETA